MKKKTKDKLNKFAKGSISIFLAFLMTGLLSLSALLVEAGRYQEAKRQLEEASISSALSLLANFDSSLESRFGLFGVDSEKVSADTFLNYLLFNSDLTESGTYKANNISKLYTGASGKQEFKYDLANYQVLKRQLLEYEKYRGPMNVASEMLDIDKIIKELKKNIEKAIPGLESMLKICDSIAELVEAIKALYCLAKDVQQLQMTINNYEVQEDFRGWLGSQIGKGWEAVEGLFSDEEWPSHDPTYETAYNNFKDSVTGKANYMNNTPKPPSPGPKPTADVDALWEAYQAAKTKFDNADLVLKLLEAAEKLGYCDENGIVDPSKKITDLYDKGNRKEQLKKLNLTDTNTREDFFEAVNKKLPSILGSSTEFETYETDELEDMISSLSTKASSLRSDMQLKNSAYSAANSALNSWNEKTQALNAYNETIAGYNTQITNNKAALLTVIDVVKGELSSYKGSLDKVTEAIDKADTALKTIKAECEKNNNAASSDADWDVFQRIKAELISMEQRKPDSGIEFLIAQANKLNALKAEDVTASYKFDNEFNTGDLLGTDSGYYMNKTQVAVFCGAIAGAKILTSMTKYMDMIKAMWKLLKKMSPFPNTYNWDCAVELNEGTMAILPSKINGGNGTSESANGNDVAEISSMLEEAKQMLNGAYTNDINSVDPNNRIEEADHNYMVSEAINRLSENLPKLLTGGTVDGWFGEGAASIAGLGLIVALVKLIQLVPTLIQILKDFKIVCENIGTALNIMISSLGESLLLNQYIIEKFPHRLTDVGDKPKNNNAKNDEIPGYKGDIRKFFPDNSQVLQTFSGAQVEYIISGNSSEKVNQQRCFWSIFAIRALNNIVGVLMDEVAMELISACSFFAPLVFILWVYLESNLDMNLLTAGDHVPLVKYGIYLSPQHLMDNLDQLLTAFDDIDEEKALEKEMSYAAMKVDLISDQFFDIPGLCKKMEYKDYLWFFLLFTSNKTKTMRIADLVQMEIRYSKKSDTFELKNMHTYARCEAEANFNSILPVLSLSNDTLNGRGFKVGSVKYVGY